MRGVLATCVLLSLALGGCGQPAVEILTTVPDDDPRMIAAIEQARSTATIFLTAVRAPRGGQVSFSVKAPFSDGGRTEHLWIAPVAYDGTQLRRTINSDPQVVKHVKLGQMVAVPPATISDWLYVENGKLAGGFTLRVLRDAISPEERAEFDRSMPFVSEFPRHHAGPGGSGSGV